MICLQIGCGIITFHCWKGRFSSCKMAKMASPVQVRVLQIWKMSHMVPKSICAIKMHCSFKYCKCSVDFVEFSAVDSILCCFMHCGKKSFSFNGYDFFINQQVETELHRVSLHSLTHFHITAFFLKHHFTQLSICQNKLELNYAATKDNPATTAYALHLTTFHTKTIFVKWFFIWSSGSPT